LIWSASLRGGRDELGRPRRSAVLASSCFSPLRRVLPDVLVVLGRQRVVVVFWSEAGNLCKCL
jgi:hypothetical protein